MAFVNERLTKEEREAFIARGIKNPSSVCGTVLAPMCWTIDRENDMCLIEAGVHRDYYDEYYFIFFWKGEQHIISLVMEIATPNTVIWKKENQASPYTFSLKSGFVQDLKNALMVFKFDGDSDETNESSKVVIQF